VSTIPVNRSVSEPDGSARQCIELAERISVCGRKLHDELSHLVGRWQLSPPQFSLLWACRHARAEGFSQNQLAGVMAVSPAHVSGLVEQLRRKGLLEGRRAAVDRRRQLWRLTPDGRDTLEALIADCSGRLDDWLGDNQRKALGRLADQLVDLLDKSANTTNGRGAA